MPRLSAEDQGHVLAGAGTAQVQSQGDDKVYPFEPLPQTTRSTETFPISVSKNSLFLITEPIWYAATAHILRGPHNQLTHQAAPTDSKKRLALAIVDYLQTSLKDGTLQPEDADSIEIATNCIAECFHVDPTDQAAVKDALGGQNLLSIYGVYEKLKGKNTTATPAAPSAAGAGSSAPTPQGAPTEESEKLKGMGNAAMQKKDYQTAADQYTKALEVCPLNPIYLSNRAAAFSAMQKHDLAKNDAELATATDPKYTKAWSRLGLARFALGDAKGSMEAYKAGIDAEGNGGSEAMKKGYETAKRKVEEDDDAADSDDEDSAPAARGAGGAPGASGMPDLGGLAAMLGGGGGGGGMVRIPAAEIVQVRSVHPSSRDCYMAFSHTVSLQRIANYWCLSPTLAL